MDFDEVRAFKQGILVTNVQNFELKNTFYSGQCFRWHEIENNKFAGIAFSKYIELSYIGKDLYIKHATISDFDRYWKSYFDFDTAYSSILSKFREEKTLKKAIDFAPGIRILKQEPWEVLASFILSQINNIKRINMLVEDLSTRFGEKIVGGFAFPTAKRIARASEEELVPIKAGFRTAYLLDAADKVTNDRVVFDKLYTMEINKARKHLESIYGVGPKVADCTLLYGFYRIETMPVDIWMKRVLETYYPKGFPTQLTPWAGIAQQYLFNYMRLSDKNGDKK